MKKQLSLSKKIVSAGLNPKIELLKLLSVFLVAALLSLGIYFPYGFSYLLIAPVGLFLVGIYLIYSRYEAIMRGKADHDQEEFVRLFTYFSVYIGNNYNVYKGLESIVPFASPSMAERLQALLKAIDEDKTVQPFADFASFFPDPKIREVMISIYQMVEEGSLSRYLEQFHRLFARLSEEKHEGIARKRLGKLESLSFLPLVGAGISLLMLALAVAEVLGGILSGL